MKKWIHVIGVCGVTTSGIALMFQNIGFKVTGSAKGFFPPVSTHLKNHGFDILVGYKKERLTDQNDKHPDIVLIQGVINPKNKEFVEAKDLNLNIQTYPEILQKYVIKPGNSIVVASTYGKTTITSALINIFKETTKNASYMVGGIFAEDLPSVKAKLKNTEWSIVEGDEYLVSLEDKTSKFFKYSPSHLIINSIQWDHPDLFPTKESYINNFQHLIESMSINSLIIANANDKNVVQILKDIPIKTIFYSANKQKAFIQPDWYLERNSTPLPTFIKLINNVPQEIIPFCRQIIGSFNDENLLAASVLAYEIGIKKERIQDGIINYKGIKRRLEIKYTNNKVTVIDDFASSPPKVKGALDSIQERYSNANIITIFEPNTGNRTLDSLPLYNNIFDKTSELILPRFTKLPKTKHYRFDGLKLFTHIQKSFENIKYIPNDDDLVHYLIEQINDFDKHTVIVFMGSHSFRGMIDTLVAKLKK